MPTAFRHPLYAISLCIALFGLAAPAGAQSLNLVSGDGQIVIEQFLSTAPLVVQALDGDGQPLEGVEISWAVTLGDGGLVAVQEQTDDGGVASAHYSATFFELGKSIKPIEVTASSVLGSVTFQLTAAIVRLPDGSPAAPPLVQLLEPSIVDPPLAGEAGQTLPGAVRARVTVQSGIQTGEPVPNVGLRIISANDINESVPVACEGPNGVVFSGADGVAICNLVLGQETGELRLAAYVGEQAITPAFRVNISSGGGGQPGDLTITSGPALPSARVGSPYAVTLAATGGEPPYRWSVAGTLPAGLNLDPNTGVISGTPSTATTTQFTVTVTDDADTMASRVLSLTIVANTPPPTDLTITTTAFPQGVINEPYFAAASTGGGCISPFNPAQLSIATGALPPGLNLAGSSIQGTPTTTGNFQFTLQATDVCSGQTQRTFVLTITGDGGGGELDEPITAAPDSMSFAITAGEDAAPPQGLLLTAGQAESFSVTVSTVSGGDWLEVNPAAGITPANVTVGVEETVALAPGTYQGEVIIVPDQPGVAVTRVAVTLEVAGPPELSVSPSILHFAMERGAPPPVQQALTVSSTGAQLPFQVTVDTETGGQWLFATAVTNATPGNVFIAVNPIGLTEGAYDGTVTVTRTDAVEESVSIPVTLVVPQPRPGVGSVTNGASFLVGSIAPGQVITIFGANLGPEELVPLRITSGGRVADELAGTRVLFDNIPGPILHTSAGQVSAIVPYAMAGRGAVRVVVKYKGLESVSLALQVAPAAPGIFVLNEAGQGAILNQNGSVNGAENPAGPGDIVSIFATGEGVVDTPVFDGELVMAASVDELPRPVLPVRLFIDGVEVDVTYAGSAPTLPAGVLQVNGKIPENLAPGPHEVVIQVGDFFSQGGVTVAVE